GMRWGSHGAQAILTMRGWDQSARFDEAWALVAATYERDIHVLANIIDITPKPPNPPRKPRKRAAVVHGIRPVAGSSANPAAIQSASGARLELIRYSWRKTRAARHRAGLTVRFRSAR
ncbi:MAG TPA: hypothetical protein VI072_29210, partial [Polyangiaceae bacterium]